MGKNWPAISGPIWAPLKFMEAGDPRPWPMASAALGDPGRPVWGIFGVPLFIWSLGFGEAPALLPWGEVPGGKACPGIGG